MQNILEIEAIKNLKARYFRLLDTKQWAQWHGLFTPDVQGVFGPSETEQTHSADELVETVRSLLESAITIHQGFTPEITLTDKNHATGIWAMHDLIKSPAFTLKGWGHYYESYVKENGEWKISAIRLERLDTEFFPLTESSPK